MIRSQTFPNTTGNNAVELPPCPHPYRLCAVYATLDNTSATDTVGPMLLVEYGGTNDAMRLPAQACGPLTSYSITWAPMRPGIYSNGTAPDFVVAELPRDLIITPAMRVSLVCANASTDVFWGELHVLTDDTVPS